MENLNPEPSSLEVTSGTNLKGSATETSATKSGMVDQPRGNVHSKLAETTSHPEATAAKTLAAPLPENTSDRILTCKHCGLYSPNMDTQVSQNLI